VYDTVALWHLQLDGKQKQPRQCYSPLSVTPGQLKTNHAKIRLCALSSHVAHTRIFYFPPSTTCPAHS
jgi:hypothetical protein